MTRDERMWLVAFFLGLSAISLVVWLQMYRLSPVLFTSRIFFQLILASTLIAMMPSTRICASSRMTNGPAKGASKETIASARSKMTILFIPGPAARWA